MTTKPTDHAKELKRLRLRRFALVMAVFIVGAVLIAVVAMLNPTCPGT